MPPANRYAHVRELIAYCAGTGVDPVLCIGAGERTPDCAEPAMAAAVEHAVNELRSNAPALSAGDRMWIWQYLLIGLAVGSAIGVLAVDTALASDALMAVSGALFALVAGFRLWLLLRALFAQPACYARTSVVLGDRDLPTYSVLVPLFREAAILPDLVEALAAIDYPCAKLDVLIILEECDHETRRAAELVELPGFMRVIVVPDRQPRTKPKALNAALPFARGAYVAVFDAEDIPARDQLRKAARAFAAGKGRYACLQARLAIYNPRASWLTRQFTAEYATLFHALLPSLVAANVPIPLSGTSNHFPRKVLEAGGWDPYNVTEDADLGIRLTRSRHGEIGLLDSATREEAPSEFRQWLPQRTRWIKGWLQTLLVHTREPSRLLSELGLWRSFAFMALIGGFVLSVLCYPLFLMTFIVELSAPQPFETKPGSFHHAMLTIAILDMLTGFAVAVAMCVIGLHRGRVAWLWPQIAALPLYWLLISVAAYRAVLQVVLRPHLWEKTRHSPRRRR